jgi:hypothetical protein
MQIPENAEYIEVKQSENGIFEHKLTYHWWYCFMETARLTIAPKPCKTDRA